MYSIKIFITIFILFNLSGCIYQNKVIKKEKVKKFNYYRDFYSDENKFSTDIIIDKKDIDIEKTKQNISIKTEIFNLKYNYEDRIDNVIFNRGKCYIRKDLLKAIKLTLKNIDYVRLSSIWRTPSKTKQLLKRKIGDKNFQAAENSEHLLGLAFDIYHSKDIKYQKTVKKLQKIFRKYGLSIYIRVEKYNSVNNNVVFHIGYSNRYSTDFYNSIECLKKRGFLKKDRYYNSFPSYKQFLK